MSQWRAVNNSSSAPKWNTIVAGSSANAATMYGNTTPGAFISGQVDDVVGANVSATIHGTGMGHVGWNLKRFGTGPVKSITVSAGGTGYSNTDTIKVSGGQTNATGTLVTNATGGISTITITAAGKGFTNAATAVVAVANSTGGASAGSGATLVAVLGGRAGRVMHETLVPMNNLK